MVFEAPRLGKGMKVGSDGLPDLVVTEGEVGDH